METQIFVEKHIAKNCFTFIDRDTRFRAHSMRLLIDEIYRAADWKTFARKALACDLKRNVDRVCYEQTLALDSRVE